MSTITQIQQNEKLYISPSIIQYKTRPRRPISIYLIDKHIVNLDVVSINSFSKNVAFPIVQQFCTGFSDIPRILVIKKEKTK
jgi:hypothetical protein